MARWQKKCVLTGNDPVKISGVQKTKQSVAKQAKEGLAEKVC